VRRLGGCCAFDDEALVSVVFSCGGIANSGFDGLWSSEREIPRCILGDMLGVGLYASGIIYDNDLSSTFLFRLNVANLVLHS
jgi:hypothetical protein